MEFLSHLARKANSKIPVQLSNILRGWVHIEFVNIILYVCCLTNALTKFVWSCFAPYFSGNFLFRSHGSKI